jgi:aspartate-semialdehyde dehydrogenase
MVRKKDRYDVAIVGATGAVGRELLEILEERGFPIARLVLLGSEESAGEQLTFGGRQVRVEVLEKGSFDGADLAFFCGSGEQSASYAPAAVKAGVVVVDGSGVFSGDPAVPLVVPEVNADALAAHRGIIANPGSSTVSVVMVLKPLHAAVRIKRVVVTTFHSVSGSGKRAMDELAGQTVALMNFRDIHTEVFPHQIAFNCLPQVEAFQDDGYTRGEADMVLETRKVLGAGSLPITATAVQVPVFRGHAAVLNIETEKAIDPNEARALFAAVPGVLVYDDPARGLYPMPIEASGKDEVLVGRIRSDGSVPHGLNCWVVSDNLRKGSALNAVQIAERLIA